MKYYNGKNVTEINEEWDESPREAYRELLLANDYLEVESTEEPKRSIFAFYTRKFTKNEAGNKYIESYDEHPVKIPIDMNKLLQNETLLAVLPNFVDIVKNDPQLSKWLIEECVYLRNSPMAVHACEILGITQEQLESIVAACRGRGVRHFI